jgi:beta-glucosidase/6-phospho-beta-glucosidase/beta-galactosidase
VKALRWGIPWYRVEPEQGVFDWRWTDEVLPYLVHDLGITPIVDLMHYGCPFWLEREFANPRYPEAVASYAAAFAERYRGLARWYTPLNEPVMNALMCGRRGLWPPYLRGDAGYARIMLQIVKGMQQTVQRLKEIDPGSIMVFVEATGLSRAEERLVSLLVHEQAQHFLCFDLLAGRVTPDHVLFPWLIRHGVSWLDLEEIRRGQVELEIIGLNFYPQWSTHQLFVKRTGHLGYRRVEQEGSGFEELIRSYHDRYNVPIMITETSAAGDDMVREKWLRLSTTTIKELRRDGVPVIGYTWFPMCTMIDWRYRFGRQPASAYRIELGLYRLSEERGKRWHASSLVPQFQRYAADSFDSVGSLNLPTTVSQQTRCSG